MDVMEKKFPDIKLLSTDQYTGATRDSAQKPRLHTVTGGKAVT